MMSVASTTQSLQIRPPGPLTITRSASPHPQNEHARPSRSGFRYSDHAARTGGSSARDVLPDVLGSVLQGVHDTG
jgi:hypothetical protein